MKTKHSLIIGGTRGLGRALVKIWSQGGNLLSVVGRREPLESDRQISDVHYWIINILDQEILLSALSEIVETNGKINNLVFFQRFRDQGNPWVGEIETNLTATKNIIERLADEFDPVQDKSIVIVSSVAANFVLQEQSAGYHVAKAGQNQLVRYFAVHFASRGIRVNSVSPAIVLKEEAKEFYLKNEKLLNLYKSIIPLGRMGTSEDVAHAISFLCSSAAPFITGQDLVVDGGLSLQSQQSLAQKLCLLD